MSDTKPGNPFEPQPAPQPCSVVSGILFSRKACPEKTGFNCVRCAKPVCLKHGVQQADKRLLCPTCNAYVNRDDDRSDDWHHRDRAGYRDRDGDRAVPAAAGAGAGAGTGARSGTLGDADRDGLGPDQGWHGGDPPGAADADESGGFDAS